MNEVSIGNDHAGTWEDRFSPAARRLGRAARAARWQWKTIAGQTRRVLIELRWRLGDEIMALPLYEAAKGAWPGCSLEVWCAHPELLAGNPWVDRVNGDGGDPDRFVYLRDDPRDRPRIAHYAALAGVREPEDPPRLLFDDWTPPPGLLPGEGPWAAVSTGASWPAKRWPVTHWEDLCRRLFIEGLRPVQLGVAGDDPIPGVHSLLGRTSVAQAARLLRACAVFVGCDSGLLHLARAAGTPAVGLFGPTKPEILFPHDTALMTLRCPRPCQGCWNDPVNIAPPGVCPEGTDGCLEDIAPEAVAVSALAVGKA
jgi:ADP-heptose:LPS heptosyltransferase